MAEIAKKHHAERAWDSAMAQIRAAIAQRRVHPSNVVVLVPYAQLMAQARSAWRRGAGAGSAQFVPRFETTMNWTRSLRGFAPEGDDLRLDSARDALTAASLLSRAGLSAHQQVLGQRLMDASWSLAKAAAAVSPEVRANWGLQLGTELAAGLEAPVFAFESATARLALAWAANSSYPTDAVFDARPAILVVLDGFQAEPLTLALKQAWAESVISIALAPDEPEDSDKGTGLLALHAAADAEDEAHRAAACVLTHLSAGRSPVALVAQDRQLTRRVHAMLAGRGVAVRDETGWKLSTTRAAAALMSLLRASVWNASTDAVLDWLKNAPTFAADTVTALEVSLRRRGERDWAAVPKTEALVLQVQPLRAGLQAGRSLSQWLTDLRMTLQAAGQWQGLASDAAGQAVLDALRLREGAEQEFADVMQRFSLSEFTAWVSQTLEGSSFSPDHAEPAQVVILPMSQLLGRPLAAVVLPGCDEVRLPVSPEPPGLWTPEQRKLLGLPSRAELAEATRAAWHYALQFPQVDILWRLSEGGEHLMASGFVQALQLIKAQPLAADPSALRALTPQPCAMPRPTGEALPMTRLSSTAFEDLRRCPYRFFALRQLKLQASDELDAEVDKRDFGNWLHGVLKIFHEALHHTPTQDETTRLTLINLAAEQSTQALGLSPSEFLPFAAAWPRVRAGYLVWLTEHEAGGARFGEAEVWKETPLGAITLVGKIDRVDRLSDGSAWVMDYKTESRATTTQRLKDPLEDTQLAFYAALLTDDTLAAAYVNVGEKDGTKSYPQPEITDLRDQLVEAIHTDMARIAFGEPLPALGEGLACEFCAARGLCRKDFWT